jgi:hypothetical protein
MSAALAVLAVVGFASAASAGAPAPRLGPSVHAAQFSPATIVVSPSTVVRGATFTVSGQECLSQVSDHPSTVYVSIDTAGFMATPDSDGIWSLTVDSSVLVLPGTYDVLASCDGYLSSFRYAPGSVTITSPTTTTTSSSTSTVTTSSASSTTSTSAACKPTLVLVDYPGSVAQGHTVHVSVSCYRPGETLQVIMHSSPIVLTTLIADSSGNASGTVTIPLDATIGAHTISVVGEFSGVSLEAPIDVVAAAETSASAPLTGSTPVVQTISSNLASTGVNAAAMTVWGVVLLVAGGIAITLTRRRGGRHVGD